MKIEFGELRVGNIARAHLKDCLDRNWVSSGPKVKQFEKEWNDLFGYASSKAVSSGTDACIQMLLSLYEDGWAQPGDEVIVPALSFIATANAVRAAGFKPVFVDIKRETLNIDEDKIEAAITPKTRAIMVVHTMGRPCEMHAICNLAEVHDLKVLEDCCEAHGASIRQQTVGKFGRAAAFSFYIAHLVCCGEGGMVSTMDPRVGDFVNSTRSHGRKDGELYFDFPNYGLNSKMNDMEASIGLEAIVAFREVFDHRRENAQRIHNALLYYKHLFWASEEDVGNKNCPHGYSITMKDPQWTAALKNHLTNTGIHWKRNFGCTPTQHGAFSYLGHKLGEFPEAEYVGDNGIHIGVHQHLSDQDVTYVCETLVEFMGYVSSGGADVGRWGKL